jgi:hypothetical protein
VTPKDQSGGFRAFGTEMGIILCCQVKQLRKECHKGRCGYILDSNAHVHDKNRKVQLNRDYRVKP